MNRPRRVLRLAWSRRWREAILLALRNWNRHQISRIVTAVVLSWLVGAVLIHLAEKDTNPEVAGWTDSLWNVWVLLFSGLDSPPKTPLGRLMTMVLLVLGVGLAGLFTASVASLLIERYLQGSNMPHFEMDNHLVLCNWSPRGVEWIREVHAKIVKEKRPVV